MFEVTINYNDALEIDGLYFADNREDAVRKGGNVIFRALRFDHEDYVVEYLYTDRDADEVIKEISLLHPDAFIGGQDDGR